MKIQSVSINFYKKYQAKQKQNLVSDPIPSQKYNSIENKPSISFNGLIPNSDLIKNGYKVAQVTNNKISNQDNAIIITSADKFLALQNSPNIWNKKIILLDDIDLNGAEIKPIGNASKPFRGEFDGNGCKISNFKINNPDGRNIGLFGKCENAKISNLEIEGAAICGKQQVGGIAGYAANSKFINCGFDGYIEGEKKLGGLIGLSKLNEIKNCHSTGTIKINSGSNNGSLFDDNQHFSAEGITGGLIGADEESQIATSYSHATLLTREQSGGLVGYAQRTNIKDCCYKGVIHDDNKTGGLIGWGLHSSVNTSYALSNLGNIIGDDSNNQISSSYDDIEDITYSPYYYWNSDAWHLKRGKLPRLDCQIKNMTPEELFIDDINADIKIGKIPTVHGTDFNIKDKVKLNLLPPKHYDENNELLKQIKKSTDNKYLRETFGDVVTAIRNQNLLGKNSSDKYDELLLAIVQNKNMDINSTFESATDDLNSGRWYNVWCSPLFILTCMNKAYILSEALKRDDADYTVGSGYSHNETILNQAIKHHIDECAYVLLTTPKMQEYIAERLNDLKSKNPSPFTRLLLESFPDDIPPYDEKSGTVTFNFEFDFPKELLDPIGEVTTLFDAQKLANIDSDYKDSIGNNIVNVAATIQSADDTLKILIAAKQIGTNINNWNDKGETPIGHAIYTNKPHFVAQIINESTTPFVRISDGTDAMILFSNMPDEPYSVNYMDIARKKGLSVNTCDKNGNTPLINAIKLKHYNAIKYLLSNGANPNLCDSSGQTPLHHACLINDVNAIDILLNSYAYPYARDALGSLPFDYLEPNVLEEIASRLEEQAILYQTSDISEEVDLSSPNCNLDDYKVLYSIDDVSQAIFNNENANTEILKLSKNLVLDSDAKNLTDDNGNSIAHIAAQSASPYAKECLKLALENGVDIDKTNKQNQTALMLAIDAYICANLIDEKINLIQNIKLLLDNNPNVDLTDDNKQSALHKICQSGNLILFNEILKLNPKINQVDINGCTPFEYIPAKANDPMYITAKEYLKSSKIIKGE